MNMKVTTFFKKKSFTSFQSIISFELNEKKNQIFKIDSIAYIWLHQQPLVLHIPFSLIKKSI